MQLNPESKKQLSVDFIQASWYFHLYLNGTEEKNRQETLGLLKQKFHEMANHIASDTSYDSQKHLQCYPILQSLTHINPHHTHMCSYTQKLCECLTCE